MTNNELIQDGTSAGFVWELGEIQYEPEKGTKVSLGQGPHPVVTDVSKFEAAFPGVILAALNGTSIKVAAQAVTRRMLRAVRAEGGSRPTEDAMRLAVVQSLKGIKSRGVTVQYTDVAGGRHSTQLEAQQASIAIMVDNGVPAETARAIVAKAAVATVEVTE